MSIAVTVRLDNGTSEVLTHDFQDNEIEGVMQVGQFKELLSARIQTDVDRIQLSYEGHSMANNEKCLNEIGNGGYVEGDYIILTVIVPGGD